MKASQRKAMFAKKKHTTEFVVDFVFSNKPDITDVISTTSKKLAIQKAKKNLSKDTKNEIIKTFVHEEAE